MDVRVEERRDEQEADAVDDPVPVGVEPIADLGDPAAVDADVEHSVDTSTAASTGTGPLTNRS